ncbi:MAG: sugar phosphate isomerase/epimerase [Angelakisella sp.]
MKYAIQMYTLRDGITDGKTLVAALEQVKALGYQGVEFAGFFGMTAAALKAELQRIGLEAVSAHMEADQLTPDKLEQTLEYAATLGLCWIVLPWSDADSTSALTKTLQLIHTVSAAAVQRGIPLLYHNHSHEFKLVDGARPIDAIEKACPLEPDLYWVFVAGENPVAYLREHRQHIGIIHLKDGDGTHTDAGLTALGEGKNDIAGLVAAGNELNIPWAVVENDAPRPNGVEDAGRSMRYLNSL